MKTARSIWQYRRVLAHRGLSHVSTPFMATVSAGCSIWCPQPRPVFACSGHQRIPPCGIKLNPAICGAENDSPLWPAQQLQCPSISSEDWCTYRMLDGKSYCRAPWTHTCWICSCDSQKSEAKAHQIVCKDRALSSPTGCTPLAGPQVQLCLAVMLETADVTWKQ